MEWLGRLFRTKSYQARLSLRDLRRRFGEFRALLDQNNRILKIIADMEEKSQGEYLLDMHYIRENLEEIRTGVADIIERLIKLGEDDYTALQERFREIDAEIELLLPGANRIPEDDLTVDLSTVDRTRAPSVGGKCAQLGEMKKLGLNVPDGFAITAWAYRRFLEANDLQRRISKRLRGLDVRSYDELVLVGEQIQEMITSATIPDQLESAIRKSCEALISRCGCKRFALRSSAIGEDTQFSFAGQYETFLNISRDEVVSSYRSILASKFSPKAIYYFLSHDITESDLAMAVGCMAMVDAAVSGVTYSRDPVQDDPNWVLVNAVRGLGKALVDGTVTPDIFYVSREDGTVVEARPVCQEIQLAPQRSGGTTDVSVPQPDRCPPCLDESRLRTLTEIAVRLEKHYGIPQDIEWALDAEGELFLLQTRPLRIVGRRTEAEPPQPPDAEVLLGGGTTICPGAGTGPVFFAGSRQDLPDVKEGSVLVAEGPFPGLVTAMTRVSAIIVETGGVASHMATIAREFRVPTLANVSGARTLDAGRPITVDATNGKVYAGIHGNLVSALQPESELFEDTEIFRFFERLMPYISPLTLVDPTTEAFEPQNCQTLHDITRFAHQRAMAEIFRAGREIEHKDLIGLKLKTDIPLPVNIIYLDRTRAEMGRRRLVGEEEVTSTPMRAFWEGVKQQGWPSGPKPKGPRLRISPMATTLTRKRRLERIETSYAILSMEYMIINLSLGYHFTTIESMCSGQVSKNYIRMQYKEGGASLDRRIRRIQLMAQILSAMGFDYNTHADFLDATISYQPSEAIQEKLRLLGRLAMMTKQLDMALSSDALMQWYTDDFLQKLGLQRAEEDRP